MYEPIVDVKTGYVKYNITNLVHRPMRLFAPSLAFVDLETTGMRAARDRITEIGIVRVDAAPGEGVPRVTEWSSLVNPGTGIPAAIIALTGITDAMIAEAPTFASLAREVRALLDGCLFVAHNARFDYSFLKHEFARLERTFTARVLCTVKLSRRLFPDAQAHHLDALIERHHLAISDRHRALADARAIWAFVQTLYRDFHDDVVESAARKRSGSRACRRTCLTTRWTSCPKRRAFISSTAKTRCRSTSGRASTFAIESPRISPAIGEAKPIYAFRRRFAASNSSRRPASSARSCAKQSSSRTGCRITTAHCGARPKRAC